MHILVGGLNSWKQKSKKVHNLSFKQQSLFFLFHSHWLPYTPTHFHGCVIFPSVHKIFFTHLSTSTGRLLTLFLILAGYFQIWANLKTVLESTVLIHFYANVNAFYQMATQKYWSNRQCVTIEFSLSMNAIVFLPLFDIPTLQMD